MSDGKSDGSGHAPRPWMMWGTVGAAAVIIVGAAVIAVPLLRAAGIAPAAPPAASPAATTPVSEPSTPSPKPSTPEPTPSCTVTAPDLSWSDSALADLSADGVLSPTRIQRIEGVEEAPGWGSDDAAFAVDTDAVGVLTHVGDHPHQRSHLSVIEPSGEQLWTRNLDGHVSVLSTPASTGVPGQLIVAVRGGDDSSRVVAYDAATGAVLRERSISGEAFAVTQSASRASGADVATPGAEAFYVSDRDSISRIDASSLEAVWQVRGDDLGVDWFEGGVPFGVTQDRVFVGTHALDARTGEALGWESAGTVFEAAGATLQTPMMYDHVGPYEISGLDTQTGEPCWSREIRSVAATADSLWLLDVNGVVIRVDPLTGETLEEVAEMSPEVMLKAVGDRLVGVKHDPDAHSELTYTVLDEAGDMDVIVRSGFPGPFVSGDQVLFLHGRTSTIPATLTAHVPPSAEPVWELDGTGIFIDAGVALRTTWDADTEVVTVDLLR